MLGIGVVNDDYGTDNLPGELEESRSVGYVTDDRIIFHGANKKVTKGISGLHDNTRPLKSTFTTKFAFSAGHLSRPFRHSSSLFKKSPLLICMSVVIGTFRSIMYFSVCQGSLAVSMPMIDGS